MPRSNAGRFCLWVNLTRGIEWKRLTNNELRDFV